MNLESSQSYHDYTGNAYDEIERLEAEIARLRAEREWVSVEGKGYADWGDDAYLVLGDSGRMCEGGWFTDEWWTAEPIGNVTHYIPLPAPPEAK